MKTLTTLIATFSLKKITLTQLLFGVILAAGLYLRIYQHFMGRSIWEDEAHLALNFMQRSFFELTKPLDFAQAGPILFLWGVKLFALIFGYGEIALRTFPFIVSLITLPLVYYIFLELSGNKFTALIGFFLFSINVALIHFSSELKPYTIDVSVYTFLIFLTTSKQRTITKNRFFLLGIFGCTSLLLSNVAFLIMTCIAFYLVMDCYLNKSKIRSTFLVLASWLSVFVINYFLFIHNHPTGKFMKEYWSFAFCPTNMLSCEFITFLNATIDDVFFARLLYISSSYHFGYVVFLLVLISLINMYRNKKYDTFIFICLPILLHLILSSLKLYPFWYRFILYLLPCFIYLIASGIGIVFEYIKNQSSALLSLSLALIPIYLSAIGSLTTFPLWYREIKPAIDFVNKQPKKIHLYMSEPINAYTYYEEMKYAQTAVFEQIPWNPDSAEVLGILEKEQENSLLFYIPNSYQTIIENLKKQKRVLDLFEFKSYGVALIKPAPSNYGKLIKTLNYKDFNIQQPFGENKETPIWNGSIKANKINLDAGKYTIRIESRGTPMNGTYPVNLITIGSQKIATFNSQERLSNQSFPFSIEKSGLYDLVVRLDNDLSNENEDRNTFIRYIHIYKN